MKDLAERIGDLATRAGRKIMEVHEKGFTVEYKEDESPLTTADKASNAVIVPGLQELYPNIPILSEEEKGVDYAARKDWDRFWLVDPLDGTKEFVKENGEFCVCIALIEGRHPIFGCIYVPTKDTLYYGGADMGAFRVLPGGRPDAIRTAPVAKGEPMVAVASRSHPDPRLETYFEDLPIKQCVNAGSALKFCQVAEGFAQLYPRFNPTMEWDTAAGQAVVEGAGGSVKTWRGERFFYNKESLLNGEGFIVEA